MASISKKKVITDLQNHGWFLDFHKDSGTPISETEVIAYNPKDGKTFCATLGELTADYDNCITANHLYSA